MNRLASLHDLRLPVAIRARPRGRTYSLNYNYIRLFACASTALAHRAFTSPRLQNKTGPAVARITISSQSFIYLPAI